MPYDKQIPIMGPLREFSEIENAFSLKISRSLASLREWDALGKMGALDGLSPERRALVGDVLDRTRDVLASWAR